MKRTTTRGFLRRVFNETRLAGFLKQNKDVAAMRAEKEKVTGVYYRLMIEHVKKVLADIKRVVPDYGAAQGYELAGFVWFQGWNDLVDSGTYANRDKPGGYDAYSTAMAHFRRKPSGRRATRPAQCRPGTTATL